MAESPSSTLSPTEEEKDNQGTHELELHYVGELDLHQHVRCDKNPEHVDFIPVRSLPLYLQDHQNNIHSESDIINFSMKAAALTTKLKVRYVSPGRSKLQDYPLSARAGKKIRPSFGSGCVTGIDDQGSFPCPLENCPHSTEPHQVYGYIIITTAAHVVFDDDEAKETIVEFFDDDPKDKKNVEIAHGVKVRHCSVEGDFCEFMCVTHSQSLFNKIAQLISLYIPFESDFILSKMVASVRILRLFFIIKMISTDLKGSSNLQAILDCAQNARTELQMSLSHCRQFLQKEANSDKSTLATVENFLNSAQSVSGILGLKDSVLRFIHQDDESFQDELLNEFCTTINVETTVKRIALLWTMEIMGMHRGCAAGFSLNEENLYIFFSDVLDVFSLPGDWSGALSYSTFIKSPRLLEGGGWQTEGRRRFCWGALGGWGWQTEGRRRFCWGAPVNVDITDQDNIIVAIKDWFRSAHKSFLPNINDNLDTILKCQLITKLSPQVKGSFSQIKDNLLCMSDYLDQVASTLNIHFGDVANSEPESVFHTPKPCSTKRERCRHVIELWITNDVLPCDDDIIRATLSVRQKIRNLIIKCADVKNIPVLSAETVCKSLVDTDKFFDGVTMCVGKNQNVFSREMKRILPVRWYNLQQHSNDSLLVHISHPHGQSKQVTIGEHFSCDTRTGHYEHIYTVPTCMGCSGGPVWVLPIGEGGKILWDQIYAVPHGGCYDGNKLNHSSSWTFSPFSVGQEKDKVNSIVPKHRAVTRPPQPSQCSQAWRVRGAPKEGEKNYSRWQIEDRGLFCGRGRVKVRAVPSQTSSSSAETLEGQRWLLYLLRSVDRQLLSGMSVKTAINFKKFRGAGKRVSADEDVEALLDLASQYKWPWSII